MTLRTRFACLRHGHQPSVRITRVTGVPEGVTYMTVCQRCGRVVEVPVPAEARA